MQPALRCPWQLVLLLSPLACAAEDLATSHLASAPVYDEAIDNGTFGYYPVRTYFTEDIITSPETNWLQWAPQCDDGSMYFLTPKGYSLPYPGPMILDSRGNLVWSQHFDNKFGGTAYNLQVQAYKGEDYLTFWLGDDSVKGHGAGAYYMLNASYDMVHRIEAANGLSADLHEFLVTPEGTALLTVYESVRYDALGSFPEYDPFEDELDPDDRGVPYIWDCLFQEINIGTGELLFEWRVSDYINVNETYRRIGPAGTKEDPFDWYHINSVQKDGLGNYLISARYTHSITYVNGKNGEIIWSLGGRRNDFMDRSDGMAINFAWQHDARFLPLDAFPNLYSPPKPLSGVETKLMTLFDNAAEDLNYDFGLDSARGLLLEVTYPTPAGHEQPPGSARAGLDQYWADDSGDCDASKIANINGTTSDYSVRVIRQYENPNAFRSSSQGSVQVIPQGFGQDPKIFVGFGLNAVWTEFNANGSVLCDAHYGSEISWERGDVQSYRVFKFEWKGSPETSPAVGLSDDDEELFVSWNGATEVVEWVLQGSYTNSSNDHLWKDVLRAPKVDFETSFVISDDLPDRFLRIIAVGADGHRLPSGTSEVVDLTGDDSWMGVLQDEFTGLSAWQVIFVLLGNLCLFSVAIELRRRYLFRKNARRSVGWLRWRGNRRGYRLLDNR